MKRTTSHRARRGFTLIELLVVIAIIAVLAGLLLPAVNKAIGKGKTTKASVEVGRIATAIADYKSKYTLFPSTAAQAAAGVDMTFTNNNADVVIILMDEDNGPNAKHARNRQRHKFLEATPAADDKSPGVGSDFVYRDPWGNPYVITMDMDFDQNSKDAFYGMLSQEICVWSYGPDGKPNTKDDVRNWK